ncbi:MAG: SRPBCC domain-containing protein [Hyphomonadaceae bacterium]|nr:SRPBCC domain-containing protein [Hyphomonadaceae bacterium]
MSSPIKIVRFTRTVKAPRQLVFDVWTKAEHLAHWFSPHGFTVEGVESDPRPGGIFKLIMVPHDKTGPGGSGFWSVGKYLEVDPPRRVVTRVGGEGADGKLMFEVINTAEFEEQGDHTIIHATGEVIAVHDPSIGEAAMAGMDEGWKQTLDRFEARLAKVVGGKS